MCGIEETYNSFLQVHFSYDPESNPKPTICYVSGMCSVADLQQIQLIAEDLDWFVETGSYIVDCEHKEDSSRDCATGEYTVDNWWVLTLLEKLIDDTEIPEPLIVDDISKFSLDSSIGMYSGFSWVEEK